MQDLETVGMLLSIRVTSPAKRLELQELNSELLVLLPKPIHLKRR